VTLRYAWRLQRRLPAIANRGAATQAHYRKRNQPRTATEQRPPADPPGENWYSISLIHHETSIVEPDRTGLASLDP
jgi:hypothetical protein